MVSNTFRQWANTLALVVIAVALVVGVGLFATEGTPPPSATGGIGALDVRPLGNLPNGARVGPDSTRIDIWKTGLIQTPLGSVSAPPYSTWGDPTSGVYFPAAGQVTLSGGGAEGLACASTGCTAVLALTHTLNPIMSSQSITPTDGGTITPTQNLVTLTPAAAVTSTLGTCTTGWRTYLYNANNFSVIITDTGASGANLAGNQTLTQYDALPLACVSGNWVQISAVSAN